MRRAGTPASDGAPPGVPVLAIVDLAAPPRELRLAFARHLLSTFARQALADLGLIPADEPPRAPGIPKATRALLADRYPIEARSIGTVAGKGDDR